MEMSSTTSFAKISAIRFNRECLSHWSAHRRSQGRASCEAIEIAEEQAIVLRFSLQTLGLVVAWVAVAIAKNCQIRHELLFPTLSS